MLFCLTLSIIRWGSRVECCNPGKGVAPSPIPWCSRYRRGSPWFTHDYGRQIYFAYYMASSNYTYLIITNLHVEPTKKWTSNVACRFGIWVTAAAQSWCNMANAQRECLLRSYKQAVSRGVIHAALRCHRVRFFFFLTVRSSLSLQM